MSQQCWYGLEVRAEDNITQFTLKRRVKFCAALDSSQAAVCQFLEDADITVVVELDSCVFFVI